MASALRPLDVAVVGVHDGSSPDGVIHDCDAIFVGGGNAFRLLGALHEYGLVDLIRERARGGTPYIGTSAGTVIAGPTLRTTNDMPIAEPRSFAALDLVPFQINPHYPADELLGGHLGETRDRRVAEFLEDNDVPVLGLQGGSWLTVEESVASVGGAAGARLLQRSHAPLDIAPGERVDRLLASVPRFDVNGA